MRNYFIKIFLLGYTSLDMSSWTSGGSVVAASESRIVLESLLARSCRIDPMASLVFM